MEKIIIIINQKTREVAHAIKDILPSAIDDMCRQINEVVKDEFKAEVIDRDDTRLKKIQKTVLVFDNVELFD